jgi:hypothetical protein
MRTLAPLSCLAFLVLAPGCSKPWEVIRQSGPPSALRGAGPVTVSWEAADLELDGHPLEEGLGLLPPAERAALGSALRQMRSTFLGELQNELPVRVAAASDAPGPGEARFQVRLLELERGARGPVGGATRLVMRVDCIVDGELVDAIRIEREQPPTMQCPSVAERFRLLAADAAALVARFYEDEQERTEAEPQGASAGGAMANTSSNSPW